MYPTVNREIARHRYLTLARVNGKIDMELETLGTLRDGQELQGVRVQKRYLGVIDKWIDYAETALEEAGRKDIRQVHWAEHNTVITFERYLQETNDILEKLYRNAVDPESKIPESYERSAPSYTPQSNMPSLKEELEEEEEDLLSTFPIPPSTEIASVSDLGDYPSHSPAPHDASEQFGTDKVESRRNRFKRT